MRRASGWFRESFRHSLAARGIATKYRKKFPNLVKNFPGENPRITQDYARFRQEDPKKFSSLRTIDPGRKDHTKVIVGRLKGKRKTSTQSVLISRKEYFATKGLSINEMEHLKERAKAAEDAGDRKFVFQGKEYDVVDVKEMFGGYFSQKDDIVDGPVDEEGVIDSTIRRPDGSIDYEAQERLIAELEAEGRLVKLKRKSKHGAGEGGYMAQKGFLDTNSHESLMHYEKRNLKGDGHKDKLERFKKGVKETLLSPKKDLDEEWKEYTRTRLGKAEKLYPDGSMERSIQRGAALFGRVVTQANVEPLIDHGDKRSARNLTNDVLFGRRL